GYLTSIPGIGWIVASHLLSRIGDWRQLRHVRQLAAFLGLVSREHSTGEQIHRGSITRTGDARLRNKLIQGAWAAMQRDPELREFYWRIYRRHPRDEAARKAIVAVARKLTTRIYAVLKEQRPYVVRPTRYLDLGTRGDHFAPGNDSTLRRTKGGNPPLPVRPARQRSRDDF
ncbi:MAG: transposase, partial [Anaerolineae bacterium]